MRRSLLLSLALLPLVLATQAKAQDNLREVYFLDLVKSRTGNTIVVEADPDTEILVFNGGELALDNRNLIVVARHARIVFGLLGRAVVIFLSFFSIFLGISPESFPTGATAMRGADTPPICSR